MKLSNIYTNYIRWAMVYRTQPNSDAPVEFVRDKFFKSEIAAWKWFDRKFKREHFLQPEAVKVSGFHYLSLEPVVRPQKDD